MTRSPVERSLRTVPFGQSAYFLLLTALFALMACFSGDAGAAEFAVKPSLTVSEEYQDNILLDPVNRREDYITHAIPAVVLYYRTPFWTWDVDYSLDYRHYGRGTAEDGTANSLRAKNHTEVLDKVLFMDISDEMARTSLDIRRDYTQQSLVVNQAEQNIFTVNPYLVLHATANIAVTAGYLYRDTRYTHISEATSNTVLNRSDNVTYADATWSLSSQLSLTAGVRDTRDRNGIDDYEQTDIYSGLNYAYGEKSFLIAGIGKSRLEFEQTGREQYWFGNAGITHHLSTVTVALDGKRSFVADPQTVQTQLDSYTTTLRKEMPRTEITLSAAKSYYRDARFNIPQATSDEVRGSVSHRLSPRTSGIVRGQYQDLLDKSVFLNAHTRTGIYGLRFQYNLSEKMTLAFDYSHIHAVSPAITVNNYANNRAVIEIRKEF